uniref:4Fe-4S binding domain protein n=1 Tax=Myoviridae sp. ctiBE32 TaxID=2826685 RepID=A0A8S5N8X8_9CAUD|nr:MAG TPA: 4Fe-4S binding domain protein [Myoviridae sp. ctiBE32]
MIMGRFHQRYGYCTKVCPLFQTKCHKLKAI